MKNQTQNKDQKISRKDALHKIGNYGKYAALTAIGTYILLNPKKSASRFTFRPWNRILRIIYY